MRFSKGTGADRRKATVLRLGPYIPTARACKARTIVRLIDILAPLQCRRIQRFPLELSSIQHSTAKLTGINSDMPARWIGSGLLLAQKTFRRIRNYKDLSAVLQALDKNEMTS